MQPLSRRGCRGCANPVVLNNLAYTLAASDPDVALKYAQQAAEIALTAPRCKIRSTERPFLARLPAIWRRPWRRSQPRGGSFTWRCPK
jgi:hypothetical protein